jgi:hypothetical protein
VAHSAPLHGPQRAAHGLANHAAHGPAHPGADALADTGGWVGSLCGPADSWSHGLVARRGLTWQLPTTSPTHAPTPTPFPEIKEVAVAARASTAVTLSLVLSKPGTAYCYAAAAGSSTAPSGLTVKAGACGQSFTAAGYTPFNLTCAALQALTAYDMYCYSEDTSMPPHRLWDSLVHATKLTVGMRTCSTDTAAAAIQRARHGMTRGGHIQSSKSLSVSRLRP